MVGVTSPWKTLPSMTIVLKKIVLTRQVTHTNMGVAFVQYFGTLEAIQTRHMSKRTMR